LFLLVGRELPTTNLQSSEIKMNMCESLKFAEAAHVGLGEYEVSQLSDLLTILCNPSLTQESIILAKGSNASESKHVHLQ
jgi:hypothetical protein